MILPGEFIRTWTKPKAGPPEIKIIVTIKPDPDGVSCGDCYGCETFSGRDMECDWEERKSFSDPTRTRGVECLNAERLARATKTIPPPGWALVPIESDGVMLNAGYEATGMGIATGAIDAIYEAMVRAAPKPESDEASK